MNKSLASAFMQPFLAVCTVHCGRLGYEMLEFQIQGMNCSLLLCYYFCEISMENWQTKRHLEIFGSMFTKLQIHFIIKAIGYCRYASFCVIIDGPHCIFCPDFTYYLEFSRIYKGGWTERAFILCKLNKSQLESSKSVGIHRQKSLYFLKNLCI